MLFNRNSKKAFSYSCQKGGEQHKNEKGEVVCSHIFIPIFTVFLFMVMAFVFWIIVVMGWVCYTVIMGNVCF